MKRLAARAKAEGVDLQLTEGANHTKVRIGDLQAVVPRQIEVNEITARAILRQMGVTK